MTERLRAAVMAHHKAMQDVTWAQEMCDSASTTMAHALGEVHRTGDVLNQAKSRVVIAREAYEQALAAEPKDGE